MIRQLLALILLSLKEYIREPGILFWALLFPILMSWGLGLAFTQKQELIRTVALVESESTSDEIPSLLKFIGTESKEVDKKIGNEKLGYTTYSFQKVSWEDAIIMVKRGQVSLIMETVKDSIKYHFDPLNPEAQLAYLQVSSTINNETPESKGDDIKLLSNVGTRYIDFLVPGMVAFGIMMSCTWGIGYSLIDKRMKKLLRRMVATPMSKSIFLLAQFFSRLILNLTEAGILIIFSYFYFDITIQGSLVALLIMIVAGNLAFSGIAILLSSRTANTQVGNGLINMVVMPMMIMSGIFFSYHNFPDWAVNVIQFFPLSILADTIRSIFIEGAGIGQIGTAVMVLLGVCLVTFTTGLKIYRWY